MAIPAVSDGARPRPAIRAVSREDLPGIEPLLLRELEHRISPTRLECDPLPDGFFTSESADGGRALVFRGKQHDLNLTLFAGSPEGEGACAGSGVFVVSNGAGVATNTVDQLSRAIPVAGMVDLKREFVEEKIAASFEMVLAARPDLDALVVNMISGIALASDAAPAVEKFCHATEGKIPVVFRFSGPRPDETESILCALDDRWPNVTIAGSTRDLVEKTTALFGAAPDPTATAAHLAAQVETALETRGRLGVTVDPRRWLTPDRTVGSLFGEREAARVGVLGFGSTARFQLRAMLEHGTQIRWVVTPTADKHMDPGIGGLELFHTVEEAVAARGDVDIVLNYAPAAHLLDATRSCLEGSTQATVMIMVAENVPYEKAIAAMGALEDSGIACVGPNSPGVMIVDADGAHPKLFKLGNMPPLLFEKPGPLSVVGRSGTVIFDVVEKATEIGTRMAWAIGGDRYTGVGFLEALLMLEQDPETRFIVLNGEGGGIQEQLAAQLLSTGVISKPVVALVTGESLPAGVQYGHQGSVKYAEADDPRVKERHLEAAGAIVVANPTEVVAVIREIERNGWNLEERRREALWESFVAAGRAAGTRWGTGLRPSFDLLYELVGHFRLFDAQRRTPEHLHELATHLAGLDPERFSELLSTLIRPDAFVAAFEQSREYTAELVRGIREVGVEDFTTLVTDLFSEESFNQALAATPWAAADLVNEAREVGRRESHDAIAKTIGLSLFRESLAAQPWNTAHAFRSINNMRWWRYVRAYDRYCTHLTGDSQLPKASWSRNPWVSVKLVRGYDRMPEGELERALDDPESRTLFFERSRTDPQGLLDLGKKAFTDSRSSGRPFPEVYREAVRGGVPERPQIESEIERMGEADFRLLVEHVFMRESFDRSCARHPNSTAQALRIINGLGDAETSGARKVLQIYRTHAEKFDTPSFRIAVERNLWMVVDLLRGAGAMDAISLDRIVDYVVSQDRFNYAMAEHQWGASQALLKIGAMGSGQFLDAHRILEDVTRDRDCFGASFVKNPRDAVEIVQVVANLGAEGLSQLLGEPSTREAFLIRMRVCPRNAAHFLQEVAVMGVEAFEELTEEVLGRPLVDEMLRSHGCNLVRLLRRINIIGTDDARRELGAWRSESKEDRLSVANALEILGLVRERVLERRLSDPDRRTPVILDGQVPYEVSDGEIRGLHESYPEWSDVLLKLEAGEEMTHAERVDLYGLVSGRKRFQTHMVPMLANFMPLRRIRLQITAGEPLIRELSRLRDVAQGEGHRFDVYFHTLEVLDELVEHVLPLDFAPEATRVRTQAHLEKEVEGVSRRDLLLLAAALHDLGKTESGTDELGSHAERSAAAADGILDRLGLSERQKKLVLDVIRYHIPPVGRLRGERWDERVEREGLDVLYEEMVDRGRNEHPVETALHYHADILGRRGSETSTAEIERRQRVTTFLLERCLGEPPGEG